VLDGRVRDPAVGDSTGHRGEVGQEGPSEARDGRSGRRAGTGRRLPRLLRSSLTCRCLRSG
jgi:hypothetical protein